MGPDKGYFNNFTFFNRFVSDFSLGDKVINDYRNNLKLNTIKILFCT